MHAQSFYILFIILLFKTTTCEKDINSTINELIHIIADYQVLKPRNYTPPVRWEEDLGLYRSEIRINIAGNPAVAELRKNEFVYVFDNNIFATGWILTTLLEANMYGNTPLTIDAERLSLTLDTIAAFHNHNDAENNCNMQFWSQMYNETTKTWISTPINVRSLIVNLDGNLSELERLLKLIGLENAAQLIDIILVQSKTFLDAFEIPADFDDTYLNIGLGATLKMIQNQYPSAYKQWLSSNKNFKKLCNDTVKYAYHPTSSQIDQNTIDPRTYFWLRDFLHDYIEKQKKNPILVTTWIQNITEVRTQAAKGVKMPFNLNNVDVTVSANVLYGITSAILNQVEDFPLYFNNDMQDLYESTGALIAWAIINNMKDRPDLAQVYYPSTYNFLWYASRTLFILERARREQQKYPVVFDTVYDLLADAYRNHVLIIFKNTVHIDDDSLYYFEDFLGTNDTNIFDKQTPTGEDRLFSTAQAVNVLLASFTSFNSTIKQLQWIKTSSISDVKVIVDKCVQWLLKNIFSNKYKPYNCFFSGSVKGFDQLPFWYPANLYQFINGTTFDPDHIVVDNPTLENTICGVQGLIDENEYNRMIEQTHFNVSTPTTFNGYNQPKNEFPFWSSQPYTYSSTLLALAQYNNIEKQ
ncbi:unnamed protein product [Didymodactylos carnosus]|uniref:Uncharacterized protein n=1 Tax=Didymodactylos carnosus TaxID=1234261 RepID=A0A814KRT1_9BILA|nr:unnamed protein product [Didymodactylos carnosus]CAF1053448.1 unnamed protein product [Didymodactylos carnosus]CAF3762548.1 unnamed protein product [Didymodactylos carnosus]CAF3822696.1 unnamed protein product [Didymodactylos carnosus]